MGVSGSCANFVRHRRLYKIERPEFIEGQSFDRLRALNLAATCGGQDW